MARIATRLRDDDRGQDTLEYILVMGLVAVAMMVVFLIGFPSVVRLGVDAVCSSVDTDLTAPDCYTP